MLLLYYRTLVYFSHSVRDYVILNDRIASGSVDKSIKDWNVLDGSDLFELKGHTNKVNALELMQNDWLASGSWDKPIKVWNLEGRKEVRTLSRHTSSIVSLKTLRNGHLASYFVNDTIRIKQSASNH